MRDPRKPKTAKANVEKVFAAPAYGGIANARKAAEKWVRVQLDAIDKGQWRAASDGDVALAEVIAQWRKTKLAKVAPKTQVSYPGGDRQRWGKLRADALTVEMVQDWVDQLAGSREPQTVHNAYAVLRGIMGLAVARGYVSQTPCRADAIELPSKSKLQAGQGKAAVFEPKQLHAWAYALPPHWRRAVWVDALIGMRAGELWGLTRADVNLLHGELYVRRALKDVAGELQVGETKTHAERTVAIPSECLDDLRAQLEAPGGAATPRQAWPG